MNILKYLTIFLFGSQFYAFNTKRIICSKIINLTMKKENSENKLEILYKPKTFNQFKYCEALSSKEDNIIIVIGPAGTGKTLMACNSAIHSFKQKNIEKIIITRPVVPVEEEIGFLPGTMVKKMDPWTRPIFDIFEEQYSKSNVNKNVNIINQIAKKRFNIGISISYTVRIFLFTLPCHKRTFF